MFKNVTFALYSLVCSLTNCSQMVLVEIFWSGIKIYLEIHHRAEAFMKHLKSIPTLLFLHQFTCNLYRMRLSRIKNNSEGYSRENHYALNKLCRPVVFLSAYSAVFLMYITEKCLWVPDCLRLFLPTWKLVQIRDKFSLQAEGLLHEQINTQSRSLPNQHYHPTKQDAHSSEVHTDPSSFMPNVQ